MGIICGTIDVIYICCSLTEREKAEREHKKRLLDLAKEHERARELERVRRYHMPQDCKVCLIPFIVSLIVKIRNFSVTSV